VATSPATVLVLRALGLGDALTGVPALRGLRRAFPDARLVLAAPWTIGSWLARHGLVDATAPADESLRGVGWPGPPPELAVDLHGRGPGSHRALLALSPGRLVAFACPEAGHVAGPPWPDHVHEVDRWCGLVRWAGGCCDRADLRLDLWAGERSRYAVLHPGASAPARAWPVDRWGSLARALLDTGTAVEVTGGPAERERCAAVVQAAPGAVDRSGATGLDDLARLVARAALVVCGDTGVAHLATACSTPSVVLFGPSRPDVWGPAVDAALHRVVWHPEVRSGSDPHAAVVDPRVDAITVAEVVAAATELLAVVP
jgi:ADP-heptose:LPS heptosyltransferase